MNKWLSIGIIAVLVIALATTGYLYSGKSTDLNNANAQIATQKTTIAGLNTDLAASKAETADVNKQLSDSQANVVLLNGNITDLTGKNTKLTTDLNTANTSLSSTQASLTSTQGQLSSAQSSITTLNATVKTVTDPKHFSSVTELKDWLQKDNTDTQYATAGAAQRAFILEVRATRAGYILPANYSEDTDGTIYFYNLAVINGTCYLVFPSNDSMYPDIIIQPLPSHPEPLP